MKQTALILFALLAALPLFGCKKKAPPPPTPPLLTSAAPTSGPVTGGTAVTLLGKNFIPAATTVAFGSGGALNVTVLDEGRPTCTTPPGNAGKADVVVTTAGGSATLQEGFTYLAKPGSFSLAAPSDRASGHTTTPAFAWSDATGERGYTLEVATEASFATTVHQATLSENATTYVMPAGALSADQTYYWRVTATNSAGATTAANAPFSFDTNRPTAFTLVVPASGATGHTTTPAFAWNDATGERGYTLEVATDAAFSSTVHQAALAADNLTYAVPSGALTLNQEYHWRVTAHNGAGMTAAANAPFSFDTNLPAAFSLLEPIHQAAGLAPAPAFKWQDAMGEKGYILEVAADAAFSATVHQAALAEDSTTYTIPSGALTLNQEYHWRVTAHNGAGMTAAANAPFSFDTNLPAAFSLLEPAHQAEGLAPRPIFKWSDADWEKGYTLEVAADAAFSATVHQATLAENSTSYAIPEGALSVDQAYHWRVTATNAAGATVAANAPFGFDTLRPGNFSLHSPHHGTYGFSSLSPSFEWRNALRAKEYRIVIATNEDLSAVIHSDQVSADKVIHVPPAGTLSPDQVYYWQVTAINDAGERNSISGPHRFNTNRPGAFNQTEPANGATGQRLTPRLKWTPSLTQNGWRVEVAADSAFAQILVNKSLTKYYSHCDVPPHILAVDQTYYWRAYAKNDNGETLAQNAPFSFDTNRPGAFTLAAPASGATGQALTPTLSWSDATGERGYTLEVAGATSFSSTVHQTDLAENVTAYAIPEGALSVDQTYYWRVTAKNDAGATTAANAPFDFNTNHPTACNLVSPEDGAKRVGPAPVFTWTDAHGETSYTLEIDYQEDFSTPISYVQTGIAAGTTAFELPSGTLHSDNTYYWRIKAVNDVGETIAANAPRKLSTTYWDNRFYRSLADYKVSDLVVKPDGTLYAGGWFTYLEGYPISYVAQWDGSKWSQVGETDLNDWVYTLALDSQGKLYAGGELRKSGSGAFSYLGVWDGVSWKGHEGHGPNSYPYDLAFDGAGNLYIAGDFTSVGGTAANRIAKWDGQSWSPLGDGFNYRVYTVTVDENDTVYAGGHFTFSGNSEVRNVAKWDGQGWSQVGTGLKDGVYCLAARGGVLYAGGHFNTNNGSAADRVARFQGGSWQALGAGLNGPVWDLELDQAGTLYAAGEFTESGGVPTPGIARWQGAAWDTLGGGLNKSAYTLALGPAGKIYVGGTFLYEQEKPHDSIAVWDGVNWSTLRTRPGTSVNNSVKVVHVDPLGAVYLGGDFTYVAEQKAGRIVRWDGKLWHTLGSGLNYTVKAILTHQGALYVGGDFTEAGGLAARGVARWDGQAWSALGSGVSYVNALTVDEGGTLHAASGSRVHLWDGQAWQEKGLAFNNTVRALARGSDGTLYAGGDFTGNGTSNTRYMARWKENKWSVMGQGLNKKVYALVADGEGNLYAGGDFTSAGTVSATRLARWDGTDWHSLGWGVSSPVFALALDSRGRLYVGGQFTFGSEGRRPVYRWDGESRRSLGSGMNKDSTIYSIAPHLSGDVYVGGYFKEAGDNPSYNFARWFGP